MSFDVKNASSGFAIGALYNSVTNSANPTGVARIMLLVTRMQRYKARIG